MLCHCDAQREADAQPDWDSEPMPTVHPAIASSRVASSAPQLSPTISTFIVQPVPAQTEPTIHGQVTAVAAI
jgi:hypothetical protein